MDLMKRHGKYLVGTLRAMYMYPPQSKPTQIDTFVDSDLAGCKGSRRSTSGGAMTWRKHVIKTWPSTQATIVFSSIGAELYALVTGAAQTLGMLAMARDLGFELCGQISSDASTALGIIQRQVLGKLLHIGIVLGSGRAATAPQFNAAAERRHDDAQGIWKVMGSKVVCTHDRPLRERFASMRVNGAPPAGVLAPMLVTKERFVQSGRAFAQMDAWTNRISAHCALKGHWVGTIEFYMKTPVTSNHDHDHEQPRDHSHGSKQGNSNDHDQDHEHQTTKGL